jgi:hypothetical protein
MVDNAIKPAIRTALRFHEIGNDTPYRISFAGKGNSGGSFGFMQGDLAAKQPAVTQTFREAMTHAGMSASKIAHLLSLLEQHQIENPLSTSETSEVDEALRASSQLVDQMDERILQEVYRDLDICIAHASRRNRVLETKAQVYMALWINMSGPPTKLLTWLDGGDPGLPRQIPAAGSRVDGSDMEEYLAATSYYVAHPRNMQHLRECAATGMRELGDAVAVAAPSGAGLEGAEIFAAAVTAAAAPSSVTITAQSSDGTSYEVSIRKTGRDTGTLSLHARGGSADTFDVTAICARADGTKLVCRGPWTSVITCTLSAGRPPVHDAIEIAVTNAWPRNSTTTYTIEHGDFDKLKGFIAQAGFPPLAPSPSSSSPATAMPAFEMSDITGANSRDHDVLTAAIMAVEAWKLQPLSPAYDEQVSGLVRAAASRVITDRTEPDILKWLELQSSAMNISDNEILRTTLTLRDIAPNKFGQALQTLPASQRMRVGLALGDDGPPPGLPSTLFAAAVAPPAPTAATAQIHGVFTGEHIFTGPRGFPVVQGKFALFNSQGTALGQYKVNTGGGARNSRVTNGPIPAGYYRLSNFRPRDTVGMVLNGIGFSFDLDPIMGTPVYGRSLFRVHPDGGSEQTNGCLGIREEAPRLAECRDCLRGLLRQGDVTISVTYPGMNI